MINPDFWTQELSPGGLCERCRTDKDNRRLVTKMKNAEGWQMCPECDRAPERKTNA